MRLWLDNLSDHNHKISPSIISSAERDSGRTYPVTIIGFPIQLLVAAYLRVELGEDPRRVCLPNPNVQIVMRGLPRLMSQHGTIEWSAEENGRWWGRVGNRRVGRSDSKHVFDP
jgi:hypothetical protein